MTFTAADPVTSLHIIGSVLLIDGDGYRRVWNPDPHHPKLARPCYFPSTSSATCERCITRLTEALG